MQKKIKHYFNTLYAFAREPRRFFTVAGALVTVIFLSALYVPPLGFPTGGTVQIPEGASLSRISDLLEERGVISSSFVFRWYVHFRTGEASVAAGDYYLDGPESLVAIAARLDAGDHRIPQIRVTVPEGYDAAEIAALIKKRAATFDAGKFASIALVEQGYLFPDTYFFFTDVTPEKVLSAMKENFSQKTKDLEASSTAAKKDFSDIVIMASILEREAGTPESRRIVSGILWNRLAIQMPLQVDAAFDAVNGKGTYSLTKNDLMIDSEYNTYRFRGLPPGAICNPGRDAIEAALSPAKTPYLYYLSERDGTMHYAKTFEEHKLNKAMYMP